MNTSLFRLIPLLLSLLLPTAVSHGQGKSTQETSDTTTVTTTLTVDAPPAAPAAPSTLPPSTASVTVTTDVQPVAPVAPAEPALRSLGDEQAPTAAKTEASSDAEQTIVPATTAKDTGEPVEKSKKPAKVKKPRAPRHDGPQNQPFAQIEIKKDDTAHEAVSILGSTKVDGEVSTDAVAILGPNTITGKVGGNAVSILGDLNIDGEIQGDAVCILGNAKFGPNAHVHGQVVSVLGAVDRDPAATIDGQMNIVGAQFPGGLNFGALGVWFKECLGKGRLLAFHSDLSIFWLFAISVTLFQVLLGLLFSNKVNHCCRLLESRPGYSLLSAILSLLIAPLLILLLIATGIGLLLVPFIAIGIFAIGIFGRVVMQAALGRLLTGRQTEGPLANAALTTALGGILVLLLYTVPILALLLHPLIGFLGTGVVVYALIQYYRSSKDKSIPTPLAQAETGALPPIAFAPRSVADSTILPPQAPSFSPAPDLMDEVPSSAGNPLTGNGTAASNFAQPEQKASNADSATAAPVTPAAAQPAEEDVPLTALPRADFGIRMLALFIDLVLVSMIFNFATSFLPKFIHVDFWNGVALLSTIYGAILWKHRGATIGDIILRLQVIRTDDRPIDWTTSIVRGLGCLLSAFALGFGFLWIAIDRDREAWHDKIAGTAVVRVPRSRPMV